MALRFARVKATSDLGTSAVSQLLAERLLAPGPPPPPGESEGPGSDRWRIHTAELERRYRVLAAALGDRLPEWSFTPPSGGLSVWVDLGAEVAERFAQRALRHGVAVATAAPLSAGAGHRSRIRLSFASPPPVLVEGVERLRVAWEAMPAREAMRTREAMPAREAMRTGGQGHVGP